MDLVEIFAYEFGYADRPTSEPSEDFRVLYSVEPIPMDEDLFENI
jgi:hypothetical protein